MKNRPSNYVSFPSVLYQFAFTDLPAGELLFLLLCFYGPFDLTFSF
jgi:hypothetical protein